MVNRMNIEQKTIQFLKQSTGSVSKAVWPSSVRRYVATGKGRRRMITLQHFLLLHRLPIPYLLSLFKNICIFRKPLQPIHSGINCVIITVIAGNIAQILCMLYDWPILFVLTVICTTTTLVGIYLVSNHVQNEYIYNCSFKNESKKLAAKTEEQGVMACRLADFPQTPRSSPGYDPNYQPVPISFPNTPIPDLSLVRVMETIDLSSTNVEHFIAFQHLAGTKPAREEHGWHIDIASQE